MPKRRPQHQPQLITQLFAMLLLVVGVGVALYPFYSGALNTMLDRARVAQVDRENQATAKQQRAALAKTNAMLKKNGLHADADPFSGLSKKQKVNLHKDQIGSLTVPKLKLTVPVFKTLIDETLAIGAAVVPGTDMPIGGLNTHTVIAGHRGLVDRRLFRDLNHLKRGNLFVFKVAGRHLAYRVFRIQVVKPSDTEILRHEPGQDLATLVTCTPYMINSHRLLVTGRRVPYTPAVARRWPRPNVPNGGSSSHLDRDFGRAAGVVRRPWSLLARVITQASPLRLEFCSSRWQWRASGGEWVHPDESPRPRRVSPRPAADGDH